MGKPDAWGGRAVRGEARPLRRQAIAHGAVYKHVVFGSGALHEACGIERMFSSNMSGTLLCIGSHMACCPSHGLQGCRT